MAYYQGKLYIGGWYTTTTSCHSVFYAYDIPTNTWTTLHSHPNAPRYGWAVAYNGKIYVTGELPVCSGVCTNQYYYYHIASNSWSPMPVFPGGNKISLRLAELNGALYGGWGHNCGVHIRDWWAFCP